MFAKGDLVMVVRAPHVCGEAFLGMVGTIEHSDWVPSGHFRCLVCGAGVNTGASGAGTARVCFDRLKTSLPTAWLMKIGHQNARRATTTKQKRPVRFGA